MTYEQIELAGFRITLHKDWLALYKESVQYKDTYDDRDMKELWADMEHIEEEIRVLSRSSSGVFTVVDLKDLLCN